MHLMHHFKLACAMITLTALLPAVAAADDRAVCDRLGSPRDAALAACTRILEAGGMDARETAATLVSRGLHYWVSELVRLYPVRDSLIDRGMFYLARQDYDRAVTDLIEARKLDPYHPSPLSGLAVAATARGDYPQALALYEQAIRQAPHLMWLYRNRAETYLNMGEHDKALDDVQRSLAVFRRDASALNQRGRIYEAMGRKQDAIADFRAALALDQGAKANADSRAGLRRLGVEP